MTLPTPTELAEALRTYVDAAAVGPVAEYVTDCANEAIAFIARIAPNTTDTQVVDGILQNVAVASPLGDDLYRREVLELGSELYYRRQARNGVVSINALDGAPIRISNDPYKAAEGRLARFVPLGFA
jgi:hypothetical protein